MRTVLSMIGSELSMNTGYDPIGIGIARISGLWNRIEDMEKPQFFSFCRRKLQTAIKYHPCRNERRMSGAICKVAPIKHTPVPVI
jgi:hypothetical protein